MILTIEAIEKISQNKRCKPRLALALGKTVDSVERWLRDNDPDGDLTKVTALQIISEETGLSQDEILQQTEAA